MQKAFVFLFWGIFVFSLVKWRLWIGYLGYRYVLVA